MCVECKIVACTTKLITLMIFQVAQIKETWNDQDVDDRIKIRHSRKKSKGCDSIRN
jgi:hypothetical protein